MPNNLVPIENNFDLVSSCFLEHFGLCRGKKQYVDSDLETVL